MPKTAKIFAIKTIKKITILTVNLNEATLVNSASLRCELESLLKKAKNHLIIDLSNCRYIDSSFLGSIAVYLKNFRNLDGDIKVVYSGMLVRTIFETSGINRAIDTFESLEEALENYHTKTSAA